MRLPLKTLTPAFKTNQIRLWGCVCWCVILLPCLYAFARYQTTPGTTGIIAPHWPSSSNLEKAEGEHSLVVFLHPKCPCSIATVRNVFEQVRPKAVVFVLVLPLGVDASFADGPVRRLLEQDYHHRPVVDCGGREAKLFGAETSGHVFLFDCEGRTQFSGGVTASRGRLGFSPSVALLQARDRYPSTELPNDCPIYGCPLHNPTLAKSEGGIHVDR